MGAASSSAFQKPRVAGVREHFERACFFASLAGEQREAHAAFRLRLAASYSCRAIVELMLEAAEEGEIGSLTVASSKADRKELERKITPALPYYSLLERIRIHDFHRFGITPPDPSVRKMMLGGPMKLKLQSGGASIAATSDGPKFAATGKSSVELQRPLQIDDGTFFDEQSNRYVSLEEVIDTFLQQAPSVIAEFEKCVI